MKKTIGIMLVLAVTVPASAQPYAVTPGGADVGIVGPFATIQYAAWVANASGVASTINVAPGVYAGFYNESAPPGGLASVPGPANKPLPAAINLIVQSGAGGTDWKNTTINTPSPYAGPAFFPQAGTGADNPYTDIYGGGAECDIMAFVNTRDAPGTSLELRGFTVDPGLGFNVAAGCPLTVSHGDTNLSVNVCGTVNH